jgi:hypothetical protein
VGEIRSRGAGLSVMIGGFIYLHGFSGIWGDLLQRRSTNTRCMSRNINGMCNVLATTILFVFFDLFLYALCRVGSHRHFLPSYFP